MTEQPDKQDPQGAAAKESYDRPAQKPGGTGHGVVIAVLVAIIVAGIVVMGVVPRLRAKAALRTETRDLAIPTVVVIHPKRGDPHQEIVLPGNMQAFEDAPIYARTNGYLKKWYVDIGRHVKTGQLLADIETPEVDQQLQVARADLNTAQANMNLSKITADRYNGLKNTDAVSKQDVDNAHGDFEAKKATVAAAESNVKRLEETLAFNRIYAPFDGIITARNTDICQLIDSRSGAAKEMFHMQSTRVLRVYINVPQQYSQAAKPGLTADLTLAEFPGRRFKGQLVRTAKAIDPASRTLLVEVDVNNTTGELFPGAYTGVHLKLPEGVPTFILPVNTLIFRSQGLQIATVQDGNKATLVPIVLGRDFGSEVEVVSGLSGQENVMVNPPDSLVEGEQVQIAQQNQQQPSGQQTAPPQSNQQPSGGPKK